ncbi:MAG: regulator of protease activity HflC (stomatin/prohibitin superfamily) [Bacteriovoracaceae bacterium]|jgi:regulator of protease activity HflC (stomatin/prohibitin superfamily)
MFAFLPLVVILFLLIISSVKILNEFERGVVFRLGSYAGVRGPGLIILIPLVEKMVKVDLRVVTMDIPSQDIITKDNVTLKVNGVVYFRVNNPQKAIIKVENFYHATSQIAQTTLRSVIGQYELDGVLAQRDDINGKLQVILDEQTEPWGIKVTNVELKAIDLPENMQRAMAKQAEAEREKRAKIISAAGEFEAAKKLAEAAAVLGSEKDAMTLRYLDTMREVASGANKSAVIFPVPLDLAGALGKLFKQ